VGGGGEGRRRKLHNEELKDLNPSPNIIRMIKSRRMRWVGHQVWGREEVHTGLWWGNLNERDHLKDKLRWEDNIKKYLQDGGGGAGTGLIWLRIGTDGGFL
jgi:hypothetical protein